ncbi:MAG: hypothetical protein U0165_18845 [Polyangiaceae bacterium]
MTRATALSSFQLISAAVVAMASFACGSEGDTTLAPYAAPTGGAAGAAGTAGTGGTAGSSGASGSSGTAGTAGSSGTAGTGGTGGSAGAPARVVTQRNPIGNVAFAQNLMIDGDFEFTGRQGQTPWLALDSNGQASLKFATGGRCHSGIKCGSLTSGQQMIGYYISPRQGKVQVSLWIKPATGVCADARVHTIDIQVGSYADSITSETETAGPDGWCHFTGIGRNLAGKSPALFVELDDTATGTVLIDDAVVLPDDGTTNTAMKEPKVSIEHITRLKSHADWITRHRRF